VTLTYELRSLFHKICLKGVCCWHDFLLAGGSSARGTEIDEE
jgi:hypothetical protein